MKTTQKERAFYSPLHKSCCDDAPACGASVCQQCRMPWPCLTRLLIDDVEEAARLLEAWRTAYASLEPSPLIATIAFLKESNA